MSKIISIVEGYGDTKAVPYLIRRILHDIYAEYRFIIDEPAMNAKSNQSLLETGKFERFLEATRDREDCSGVVVLLDAEKEYCHCPPSLGYQLADRAKQLQLPFPVVVVCASGEYEAWFLASLHTLSGQSNLKEHLTFDGNVDMKYNAKAWLTENMLPGVAYKETRDQLEMTRLLDLEAVQERSRSFRRLVHALEELILAIEERRPDVTPRPATPPSPGAARA